MTTVAIQNMLYLLDEAFSGSDEHSLLANLRSVQPDEWSWLGPGGGRSIFDIVQHIGECKYVYDNHAFGDRSMRWTEPDTIPTITQDQSPDETIAWLTQGHQLLHDHVGALADDSELLAPRMANWGTEHETRWLISVMIEHDLYHGGEINHIRALKQGNDAWAWPSNR